MVDAVRTPIGRRNGVLAGIHPADLSALVLRALIDRTGLAPALVDDVVWGCVSQVGEQTFDIGRTAVLSAGWPETVPGTTVDRQCGSSQQALHFAAAGVIAGHYDIAIAGGVESMSRVPMLSAMANGQSPLGVSYVARYGENFPNQGIGAEMIAERWGISRAQADEFALASHAKAALAADEKRFVDEIVPVTLDDGTIVSEDEGIRRDGSIETLASLKTVFREDGVITAANSSQISDGAAAVLLMTSEGAAALGMQPLARVHSAVVVGSEPNIMLTGPIAATQKVLKRSGLSLEDIGVFEVNEAFAPVPMAWLADIGAEPSLLNPKGGAIALGHPLGASGARLLATMVHHMRAEGIRFGLQTMCEGGGQANATVVELLE
jgi:acetyl-CoA acyltransferase